jgi:hypothetical protein
MNVKRKELRETDCWKLVKTKRKTIGNFTTEFAEGTESGGETEQSGFAATNKRENVKYNLMVIIRNKLAKDVEIEVFSCQCWCCFTDSSKKAQRVPDEDLELAKRNKRKHQRGLP